MNIKPEQLNESIRKIALPDLMLDRPVSRKGYPVPFFAAMVDGEWDFRVVHPGTAVRCVKEKLCWVCGKPMGSKKAFVVGPMCVVTRTSAEPPCHHSCATYAAIACPFLAMPRMKRNEADLPEGHQPPAGKAIMRNPGCSAVLVTRSFKVFNDGSGGMLIRMGDPEEVRWYARRDFATYTDVVDSIASGIQLLYDECEQEKTLEDRADAFRELGVHLQAATRWLPRPRAGEVVRTLGPPVAG